MKLTKQNKTHIDGLTYSDMVMQWNNSTPKYIWFRGETGDYWRKRMSELCNSPSKSNLINEIVEELL